MTYQTNKNESLDQKETYTPLAAILEDDDESEINLKSSLHKSEEVSFIGGSF